MKTILLITATLILMSCEMPTPITISHESQVELVGKVVDASGNPQIIDLDDQLKVCTLIKIQKDKYLEYEPFDTTGKNAYHSGKLLECQILTTNQDGDFILSLDKNYYKKTRNLYPNHGQASELKIKAFETYITKNRTKINGKVLSANLLNANGLYKLKVKYIMTVSKDDSENKKIIRQVQH